MAFPNDRPVLKFLVYGVFVIEALQTFLFVIDGFSLFTSNLPKDMSSIDQVRLYWLSAPTLGAISKF